MRAHTSTRPRRGDALIRRAIALLDERLREPGVSLSAPTVVRDFLRLRMAELEHEVFAVLFLNTQNRLIEYQEMFRGTLTQTHVYPREVARQAMRCNASAVILAHNHPSGVAEPSRADELLTITLKETLDMVDVKVLDHIVVGGRACISFAEKGLI